MAASKFRIASGSFTSDTVFSGSATFAKDVTVEGTLNVHEMKTTLVSSSIIFKSGSTKFGDTSDDLHQFTGSVEFSSGLSGSLTNLTDGTSYLLAGNNVTIASSSNGQITIASSGGASDVFKTISVSGQDDVVADSATDTLTLAAAGGMTITTTAGSDTVTLSSADTNTQNTTTLSFVDSSDDIILRNTTGGAGSGTDDIKFVAGSNITLTHTDADNITIAAAGGSSAAGSDTQVQFNDGGSSLGGDAGLVYNKTSNTLTSTNISGSLTQLSDGSSYLIAGTNVTITTASNGSVAISSTADQNVFSTIAVSGQTNVVADAATDTLTLAGGSNVTITTNAGTDTITFAASDTNTMGSGFTVSATTDSNATTITQGDDLMFAAGTGITCETTADGTVTISSTVTDTDTNTQNTTTLSFVDSSDDIILRNTTGGASSSTQDIKLVAGSNVTLTHTDANNFTIAASSGTDTTYTAGTGIDLSGTEFTVDVSDFMANGSNNRVVTATGADAMNAEANLTFDGTDLSVSGKVKTTGIEYTDGDEAITVQDGGYIKYEAGVTHSPAVRVNAASTATNDQWIKIAEASTSTSGDTIITNLLVTICGQELGTDEDPAMYCSFIIHAEFTPKSTSPYYEAAGTALIVDTFSKNNLLAWGPRADIFISYEEDSTPLHNLYIRVKEANKDVYVTHLGGTDTDGLLRTDPAMSICTGQSFEAGGVDTFSLGGEIYGEYASKILTGLTVLGANAGSPSTINLGDDVDGFDRLLVLGHSTNKMALGIHDPTDKFAINSGGVLSAASDFQMDASGNVTLSNGSLTLGASSGGNITVGSDADGNDRTVTFGHSTLKSVVGIDDSQDKFAINTDASFETDNDFAIDANGNVTMPNTCFVSAQLSTSQTNIAINTSTDVVFDTEHFDNRNAYNNTTGVFTAPVDGYYLVMVRLQIESIDTAATEYNVRVIGGDTTVKPQYMYYQFDPNFSADTSNVYQWSIGGTSMHYMDANDTIKIQFRQSSGTQQTDLDGTTSEGIGSILQIRLLG